MSGLKKIVPLVLVGAVVFNWSHPAFAGQNIDLGKVQDNRKKLIDTSSCPGCELAGVNLSGVNLDRANLTGANLKGANLSQARLHLAALNKANLQNADLRDVEFGGADLAEADLRGANLKGATFVGAYLVGTQLDKEVSLNQPSEKLVSESIPPHAKVLPAQVKGNKVSPPSAEPGFFDKTWDSMKGLFGQGESVENKAVVKKTAVTGKTAEVIPEAAPAVQALPKKDVVADIAPVKEQPPAEVKEKMVPSPSAEPGFVDKTLGSVKGLFGQGESKNKIVAEKHDGDIQEGKQLQGNETAGAQIPVNKINPVSETAKNKALLLETKRCYGCNLTGVDLTGKNMESADLEGADLTGSRLESVNFENANLKGAILVKVDLRNADLRKADLYKANLAGADLTGAKLDGALLDDAQLSDTVGYELQGKQ